MPPVLGQIRPRPHLLNAPGSTLIVCVLSAAAKNASAAPVLVPASASTTCRFFNPTRLSERTSVPASNTLLGAGIGSAALSITTSRHV
jgi:hypothetical protein